MCAPVQPAEVGAKLSPSKSPLRKLIDVQDTEKSSQPYSTGLHTESQVDRTGHNILNLKTSQVCHSSNKYHLLVELRQSTHQETCSTGMQMVPGGPEMEDT